MAQGVNSLLSTCTIACTPEKPLQLRNSSVPWKWTSPTKYSWKMVPITSLLPHSKWFVKLSNKTECGVQSSKLLEIRPSVFPSLFPLHTKNNACVCTLDSDIKGAKVSYGQGCRASLFPGNQHSGRLKGQGPQPRSPHIARETVWFMVHPSPSSWDSDSRANLLFLVWGQ